MQQELTPAAARRRLLKSYGLTEDYLRMLRSLDEEEARWRIEHEHKIVLKFVEEKRLFMIADCVERPPDPRTRKKRAPDEAIVTVGEEIRMQGSQLG